MVNDSSYKVSFAFALAMHLVLVGFLFIKFTNSKSTVAFSSSNSIINAIAINERDFDNQMRRKTVKQEAVSKPEKEVTKATKEEQIPQKIVPIKKPKNQLQTMLKKNLLTEQAREMAELRKERQKYQKNISKKKEQQLQKILQEQIAAEKNQLIGVRGGDQEEEHGGLMSGAMDKHKAMIIQSISSNWIVPEGVVSGDFCQLLINVAPGGLVLDVKLIGSSGNLVLDRSSQAAVLKASPLPVPDDPKLFDEMRAIKLTFRPEGIVGG
ncbi:MAG: cell envelope integrity protein TolA [Gammaproteobacteria bacterium]|nr:cell envelope integrity protein TolA [Gammaproteobacteria bacterium]